MIYTVGHGTPAKLTLPPISAAAPGTLYQQIVDGLKREVSEGRLAPGSPLPSFRSLAEELLVSVITVKRAYEELEREGIIYRRQGWARSCRARRSIAAAKPRRTRARAAARGAARSDRSRSHRHATSCTCCSPSSHDERSRGMSAKRD